MIDIADTMHDIKKEMTGKERIVVSANDPRLQTLATEIADFLQRGPPVLAERGGLEAAIRSISQGGGRPLVLLWTMDMEEYGSSIGLRVLKKIPYDDPRSIFNRPTLSLISRTGPFWDRIPERPRAVYQKDYKTIAEDYIEGLRRGGMEISSMPVTGDISSYFRNGTADIGIGVLDGEEMLVGSRSWPLDRILPGDPVLASLE